MNVRDEIIADRIASVAARGPAQGLALPESRNVPLVRFCREASVICEIKRASPSKGVIAMGLDPAAQARLYEAAGVRNISVLTEESRFSGSLRDLQTAKAACPDSAFLRKDFLLDERDIDVSFLYGADAVLLIASILDRNKLKSLRERALAMGMRALVEVHSAEDVEKARFAGSDLTGINSRNLQTLKIDLLLPLRIKSMIDWDTKVIFESGITGAAEAGFAATCGFDGILVGESVSRDPGIIPSLVKSFYNAPPRRFWPSLYAGRRCFSVGLSGNAGCARPLVKICGLTNADDVRAAEADGADVAGFVFADSPRRVDAAFLRSLEKTEMLRVAVVTCPPDGISPELLALAESGCIDAVQFHDDLDPAAFRKALEASPIHESGIPFYKALRVRDSGHISAAGSYAGARILLDAHSGKTAGGTGLRLDGSLVRQAAASSPGVWLAGGLDAGNIAAVVREFQPELVDASSGLEYSPGKKDHYKMKAFIDGAKNARA